MFFWLENLIAQKNSSKKLTGHQIRDIICDVKNNLKPHTITHNESIIFNDFAFKILLVLNEIGCLKTNET